MKYMKTIFLSLALFASQATIALECSFKDGSCYARTPLFTGDAVGPNNLVQLNPHWESEPLQGKLPKQITILDQNSPITDEILIQLNPTWWQLKDTLSTENKNEILREAIVYPGGDYKNHIRRCLIAAALWIGASPETKKWNGSMLEHAALHDDYELAQYILSKMSPDQIKGEEESFRKAKSIRMAQLLLSAGMKIPSDILISFCTYRRSTHLIRFYLEHGVQPDFQDSNGESALHKRSRETAREYKEMTTFLLNAGANIALQNKRLKTPLHSAAYYLQLHYDAPAYSKHAFFCRTVIQHYLDAHHAFLGFLWHLKKNEPQFYSECKYLRSRCFAALSPMRKLRAALLLKDDEGKTAYEVLPLPELNPNTCTYENLKKLPEIQKPV